MHSPKLLKSADNPAGPRLADFLRRLQHELEHERARHDAGPERAVLTKLAGLVIVMQGEVEAAETAGHILDTWHPPRLVPPPRR
jgi:hypothetical protein